MPIQATDKRVYPMPRAGWQSVTINKAQRVPGFGGRGFQMAVVVTAEDEHGEQREFRCWLPIPEGEVVNNGHLYLRFGAALAGKEVFAPGEVFDDDPAKMIGQTVLAEVVHTVKGERSANKGAPDWKFNSFKPLPPKPIGEEEAGEIKRAMYTLWPGQSEDEKGKRLAEGRKLVFSAVGHERKVAELTAAEAKLVWKALNVAAEAAGKPPFRTIVDSVPAVESDEEPF